jgi:hypothetical protein
MLKRVEELYLNQNYSFHIKVENNGTHFSGELILTPDLCSLIIRGDIFSDRCPDFLYGNIDEMVCTSFEGTFVMYGLRPRSQSNRILQHYPSLVSYFENKYSLSKIIFIPGSFTSRVEVRSMEIDSRSISKWVGSTTTQDSIVNRYSEGNLFFSSEPIPDEFEQCLGSPGTLCIAYKPHTYYESKDFSLGFAFPPVLLQTFNTLKNGTEVIESFHRIETILSFLVGHSLDVQAIRLVNKEIGKRNLSLYIPRGIYVEPDRNYEFFPLGLNLRANQMGLPEFPLNSFVEYFNLAVEDLRYFQKYLKYRQLQNPEEQFLGFFRLLEKLCFQKDCFVDEKRLCNLIGRTKPFLLRFFGDKKGVNGLLKGVLRLNNTKLNTAGCIIRFMKTLPTHLVDSWIYGLKDVEAICRVRNDLTHANEFEPAEFEIERKAKFIEILLIINLLYKIGVPINVSASVVPRVKFHDLIRRQA